MVVKDVAINYIRRDIHILLNKIKSSMEAKQAKVRDKSSSIMKRWISALSDMMGINK